MRSAVELWHRVRLDVQHGVGPLRQRPDAGTVARPDRIRRERLQRHRPVGRQARSRLRAKARRRFIVIDDRALSQVNLFWHHKFCSGADSWLWFGLPDHGRYDGDKSFADWMIGFNVQVPLSDRLALYANASYLHPSAAAGADAAVEQGYDVSMGIMWYFGGHARSNAINGKCWLPYLPVANNSTFLVEQGFDAVPNAVSSRRKAWDNSGGTPLSVQPSGRQ